jgi:hypothetical protein
MPQSIAKRIAPKEGYGGAGLKPRRRSRKQEGALAPEALKAATSTRLTERKTKIHVIPNPLQRVRDLLFSH